MKKTVHLRFILFYFLSLGIWQWVVLSKWSKLVLSKSSRSTFPKGLLFLFDPNAFLKMFQELKILCAERGYQTSWSAKVLSFAMALSFLSALAANFYLPIGFGYFLSFFPLFIIHNSLVKAGVA